MARVFFASIALAYTRLQRQEQTRQGSLSISSEDLVMIGFADICSKHKSLLPVGTSEGFAICSQCYESTERFVVCKQRVNALFTVVSCLDIPHFVPASFPFKSHCEE